LIAAARMEIAQIMRIIFGLDTSLGGEATAERFEFNDDNGAIGDQNRIESAA